MRLNGYYQYPGQAAREEAVLTLNERHLVLECKGQQQLHLLNAVTVSDALGTIPLTLTFADGGRFVPEHDQIFRQWWQLRHRPGLVHRLERYRRGVALTLLATVAAIALYVGVILPAVSTGLAYHVPAWAEKKLGQNTWSWLEDSAFSDGTLMAEQQQHVQQLFNQIIPAEMRQDETPLQLKVVHFSGGANAFMLADGSLVVSDDLVKLAKNDDALAAVMLHEMGHHFYRHPMRMLVRSSIYSLGYMWLTGDVNGIGDTVLQSATFVDQMKFSRGMEEEADQYAITQMKAQGRSLSAMAEMYAQLQQAGEKADIGLELPDWLSTHPDMPERIKAIQSAASTSTTEN